MHEAENLTRRALEFRREVLGHEHPYTFKTLSHLARVLKEQGKVQEAIKCGTEANVGMRDTLGLEHPDVIRSDEELKEMRTAMGKMAGEVVVEYNIWGNGSQNQQATFSTHPNVLGPNPALFLDGQLLLVSFRIELLITSLPSSISFAVS